MKKENTVILFTIYQIFFTEKLNAIRFANKMQHFQDTKNPNVKNQIDSFSLSRNIGHSLVEFIKVGFIHLINVINMTLDAKPTRTIKTSNVDECNIECFMATPACFGLNFVRTMNNTSDSTNCKLYQEDVLIYNLVPNEWVDHYALENPCLNLPCHNGGTCIRNVTLDTYSCKCAVFYSGTNCDNYGEIKPVKNNIIRVLPILRKTWSLSLDIKPMGLTEDWGNIVHATINGNTRNYGDRTPAIFFFPISSEVWISSAINSNVVYNIKTQSIPLNYYTNVNVSQVLIGKDYVFSIFINGSKVHEEVNNDVREFKDVKLYASDSWFVEANAFIKNLIYENIV